MVDATEREAVNAMVEELEQEASSQPQDKDLQRRLGWALYSVGRLEEAQRVLDDAMTRHPQDIELLYSLGMILKATGEFEKARGRFRQARDFEPVNDEGSRSSMLRHLAAAQLQILDKHG